MSIGGHIAVRSGRGRGFAVVLAQRKPERLLKTDDGGERKWAAAAQRLLQGRDADLGLVREGLARDAPARDLLAHLSGDEPALLSRELLFQLDHRPARPPRSVLLEPTAPHQPAQTRTGAYRSASRKAHLDG